MIEYELAGTGGGMLLLRPAGLGDRDDREWHRARRREEYGGGHTDLSPAQMAPLGDMVFEGRAAKRSHGFPSCTPCRARAATPIGRGTPA